MAPPLEKKDKPGDKPKSVFRYFLWLSAVVVSFALSAIVVLIVILLILSKIYAPMTAFRP